MPRRTNNNANKYFGVGSCTIGVTAKKIETPNISQGTRIGTAYGLDAFGFVLRMIINDNMANP